MQKTRFVQVLILLALAVCYCTMPPSFSKVSKSKHASTVKKTTAKKTVAKKTAAKKTIAKSKSKTRIAKSKSKRSRMRVAHRKAKTKVAKAKRYAYPAEGFFMWSAPEVAMAPMPRSMTKSVRTAFNTGMASRYSPSALKQAGIFVDEPLRGGIFNRRENVKYIILHSTETGRPANGPRVIKSWNHGMRHAGAQYVVDRDGTIYQTVDPEYGTVHVDIFRTLNGINNDNAIGIEMVRAGKQKYTANQLESVTKLVTYLQGHFNVPDGNIYGHGQVQPSDRTDPVAFNWTNFYTQMTSIRGQVMALKGKTRT